MNPLKLQIIIEAITQKFNDGIEKTKEQISELKQFIKDISSGVVEWTKNTVEFGKKFNEVIKNNVQLAAEFAREIGGVKGGLLGILALKNASFGDLFGNFTINAGVLGLQIKQAKDFESVFADAKKVIDGTDEELTRIEKTIKRISITEIPLPLSGLVDIAKSGGQLGIAVQDIEDYTKTVSQTAVAFDILANEAGQSIGTLTNVFQEPLSEVKLLIDQINVLGDTTAATERDILDVIRYVGGLGKTVGLTKGDIAALSATMLSLGKAPEIARTSIVGLLTAMATGENRGKEFNDSLKSLGITSEQLANNLKENPRQALLDFLSLIDQSNEKTKVLSGLFGLGTDATSIGELSSSLAVLKTNIAKVSDEASVAGSALRAFEARANTLDNKLQLASNAVAVFSVNVGNPFLAPVKAATDGFIAFVSALARLAQDHTVITTVVKIVSLIAPLGLLLNSLRAITAMAASHAAVAVFAQVVNFAKTALGAFTLSTGGAVAAVAVLTGVIGGVNSLLASLVIALGVVAFNAVKAFNAGGVTIFGAALAGVQKTLGYLGAAFAGGSWGILLTVIAGLIVAYTNLKDVVVKVGDTSATVAEFIAAVWRVATGGITDSIGKLIDKLTDLIDKLTETGDSSDQAAKKSQQSWNLAEKGIIGSLQAIVNFIKGASDFLVNYTTIQMDRYVSILRTRLNTAVELAKASGKDLNAALHFDFSFSNAKQAISQDRQQVVAINANADQQLKQSLFKSLTTDYVQNEVHYGQSQQYTDVFNKKIDALNKKETETNELAIQQIFKSVTPNADKPETDLEKIYQAAEEKYQLRVNLVKAIATVESGGRQEAVSHKGAVGVMQVVPSAHPEFNPGQLRINQAYNVDAGAQYLNELSTLFKGDLVSTIAAYNAGQGNVQKYGLQGVLTPGFAKGETLSYVEKVLTELDKLEKTSSGSHLVEHFKATQDFFKSRQDAATVLNEGRIETRLKTAETTSANEIERLNILKEQGKIGITEFYQALTTQQETVVKANIQAVNERIVEIDRQSKQAQSAAKPEDLPKITAEFTAKKDALNVEQQSLQQKLANIAPANLIDQAKEQKDLDDVVNQVKAKLAELRGETVNDPIAIKARLELENADVIKKLKQAGQSGLADQYISGLSASEQASLVQTDISRVQERTQTQETRINVLQQSRSISQFEAQQQLKKLYAESADELDTMADKLSALGENSGLDEVKIKALNAKNAAAQLRATLPDLSSQFIDAAQSAGIASMTQNLNELTSGAKSAGAAFADMGLSIVKSLQNIANQKLSEQIFGYISNLAISAISGGVTGGGTVDGINTSNASLGGSSGFWSSGGAQFQGGSFATGGLVTPEHSRMNTLTDTARQSLSDQSTAHHAISDVVRRSDIIVNKQSLAAGGLIASENPANTAKPAVTAPALFRAAGGLIASESPANTVKPAVTAPALFRAAGGLITGPGTETSDSIPMSLPVGSFIINANSTKKIGVPVLQQFINASDTVVNAGTVPVNVSNREFFVPPPAVVKYGRAFFEHINKNGLVPPASLQRAYAQGGLVGDAVAGNPSNQSFSGDTITINVPVTIHQAQDSTLGNGKAKFDVTALNALSKDLQQTVDARIAHHLLNGGLLSKGR
ncbi:MAG: phage tail tape measure protein [Methylovulum sp.]|nr:phage tail tape measure protein [Methylovulum sp.]